MPRKHRVWYKDAIYHIMCRGNHRHDIFRDDEDRQIYLTHLLEVKKLFRCNILSYCLMTNHVHLQVETTDIDISTIMKKLNMMYVIYFNNKYKFVGHLFQGRYRSELIETDAYILEISKYIHINPVRANIVDFPLEYTWSSYKNYLNEREDELVSTEKILRFFKNKDSLLYKNYVEYYLNLEE